MAALLIPLVTGCNKAEEKAKDSVVDVFKGDAPEPEAPAPQAEHIGTLPVFDPLSAEGTCTSQTFSGITAALTSEVRFRERFPARDITVGIGSLSREFRPVNIDARVTRDNAGMQESEALVASFSPDGRVTGGQRQYSTADNSVRERRDVTPAEEASILSLVRAVYDRCTTQR